MLAGRRSCLADLQARPGAGVRVVRAPCVGRCDAAPAAEVGHNFIDHANVGRGASTRSRAATRMREFPTISTTRLMWPPAAIGTLERLRAGELSADAVLDVLDQAGLRGLGGAGLSDRAQVALGARRARRQADVRSTATRASPARSRTASISKRDPHRFLEGMLIGAAGRGARPTSSSISATSIRPLEKSSQTRLPSCRPAARSCICGAAPAPISAARRSSLIESVEGKRGLPRNKPPFAFQVGLFGRPDADQQCRDAVLGARSDRTRRRSGGTAQGRNGGKGLRSFSVSGRVQKPGMKLAPAGITVAPADRRILRRHGGGPHVRRLSSGRRFGRHFAGFASAIFRSISARSRRTAASSARRPSSCSSPTRTMCGRWR